MKPTNHHHIENNQGGISHHITNPPPAHLTSLSKSPTPTVIGRDTDLQSLKMLLQNSLKVVLVNGMGGIGKTTLAHYFLEQEQSQFQYIAWIDIVKNTKEAFVNNVELTQNLRLNLDTIPKDENFMDESFELIMNKLRSLTGQNLLIIDNAQGDIGEQAILQQIALGSHWKVLVTSRQSLIGFETYELGFLALVDAIQLFYLHYNMEKNDALVQQIVEILDSHTLLIEVVAKTAQAQQMNLEQMTKYLQKQGLKLLEQEQGNVPIRFAKGNNHRLTKVFSFLLEMFDLAALSLYEKWVLMQFSVLPSVPIDYENDLGENINQFLLTVSGKDRIQLTDSLNNIVKNGWLLHEQKKDNFKMHHLIQEVIRERLKPTVKHCLILLGAINDLVIVKPGDNGLARRPFIKYAESLLQYLQEEQIELANLANNLSGYFIAIGDFQTQLKYLQRAIDIKEKLPDENIALLAAAYSNIAIMYRHLGEFEPSLNYNLKAIKLKKQLGEDSLDLALSYSNIGVLYEKLGKFELAIQYLQDAIRIREKFLIPPHYDLALAYHNIAVNYQKVSNLEKDLDYNLKALKMFEQVLDTQHPTLAISYTNVSVTYRKIQDAEKALKYAEKAVQIKKAIYDKNHPSLANSYNNLGLVYNDLKKHKKALNFIAKAFQIRVNIFSKQHPALAQSYNNLAITHRFLKNYEIALNFGLKALDIERKIYPATHHLLAASYKNRAFTFLKLRHYSKAKHFIQDAILIYQQIFESSHPSFAEALILKEEIEKAYDLWQKGFDNKGI